MTRSSLEKKVGCSVKAELSPIICYVICFWGVLVDRNSDPRWHLYPQHTHGYFEGRATRGHECFSLTIEFGKLKEFEALISFIIFIIEILSSFQSSYSTL